MEEMTNQNIEQPTSNDNITDTKDIDKQLREYNKLMMKAAADLDFETAIMYRNKIKQLEEKYLKS